MQPENTVPINYERSFCCCGNLPNEACGWPEKTVRALLALLVVVFGIGAEVAAAMWLLYEGETSLAIGLIGLIATEVTGVSGYYFGLSRASPHMSAVSPDDSPLQLEEGEISREDNTKLHKNQSKSRNKSKNKRQSQIFKAPNGMEIEIRTTRSSSEEEEEGEEGKEGEEGEEGELSSA